MSHPAAGLAKKMVKYSGALLKEASDLYSYQGHDSFAVQDALRLSQYAGLMIMSAHLIQGAGAKGHIRIVDVTMARTNSLLHENVFEITSSVLPSDQQPELFRVADTSKVLVANIGDNLKRDNLPEPSREFISLAGFLLRDLYSKNIDYKEMRILEHGAAFDLAGIMFQAQQDDSKRKRYNHKALSACLQVAGNFFKYYNFGQMVEFIPKANEADKADVKEWAIKRYEPDTIARLTDELMKKPQSQWPRPDN